jgi:hypothetical protein
MNNGTEGYPDELAEAASFESTWFDENHSHVLPPITI